MNKLEQEFETWWEREGQEFLFALNTTTDDDIKLVAEIAWKNGAYCAEQAEQERKYGELAGTHNWTPPNYTDEQWQKLDQEYQDHVAEQAEQEPECKYKEAYIIWQDKTEWVQETAQPKELGMHRADVLRQRIENLQNAATHPVRTKDLTDDEIAQAVGSPLDEVYLADFRAVIAADRSKNK